MGSGKGKTRRAQAVTPAQREAILAASENQVMSAGNGRKVAPVSSIRDALEATESGPFRMRTVKPHLFEVFNKDGKGTHEYFGARDHKGDKGAREAARARAKELNELHVKMRQEYEEGVQRRREVQDELGRVERVNF